MKSDAIFRLAQGSRLLTVCLTAMVSTLAITLNAADWTGFRGPNRDGHTDEKVTIWPPVEQWRADIGASFAQIVVSQGKVYAFGWSNNQNIVWCFDEASTGTNPTPLWTSSYSSAAGNNQGGNLGVYPTPTVSSGKLYTCDNYGVLNCYSAASGALLWSSSAFSGSGPDWAGSPVVEGDLVIVNAGGNNGAAAISISTHNVVWGSAVAGSRYASPSVATIGTQLTIIGYGKNVTGLDPATGNVLWYYPYVNSLGDAIANPLIIDGNKLFVSQGYNAGCVMVPLGGSGLLTRSWGNQSLCTKENTAVVYSNYVYGTSDGNDNPGTLRCLDLSSGNVQWLQSGFGVESALLSVGDQLLIMCGQNNSMPGDYTGDGNLVVAKATPTAYTELYRTNGILSGNTWITPTFSNGRLYIHNTAGKLICLQAGAIPVAGCSTRITFAGYNQSETLTNFPVLVDLSTNIPGFDYSQFGSHSGGDLRFTASDGTTELNYEMDTWNTNGTSYVWVQVPKLSSSNDYIWAFWGNANLSVPVYTTNGATWDSTFAGVWHLTEAVSLNGIQHDSTSNHDDMVFAGSSGTSVMGTPSVVGGGDHFVGLEGLQATARTYTFLNNVTMSCWAKSDNADGWWTSLVMGVMNGQAVFIDPHPIPGSAEMQFAAPTGSGRKGAVYTSSDMANWHYWTGTYDSGSHNIYFYYDGFAEGHSTDTPILGDGTDMYVAYNPLGAAGVSSAMSADEVRLENVPRSSNWVWSCFMTMASNSVFQKYGIVQGSGYIPVPGALQFGGASYTVVENAGTATILVTRTNGSSGTVTVNYTTANGTAMAGTDYTAAGGTLTFQDSETSKTFTVAFTDNGLQGPDKTVNLILSSPTGGASFGGPTNALLTIVNDNKPMLEFSSPTYEVSAVNNGAVATITVMRSKVTSGAVSVSYATANGTAIAGTDYTATSGTLSFGDGQTSATFTIPIAQELVYQPDKTVNLTLSNPIGGTYGALVGIPGTAVLTIIGPPMPTIFDAWANRARITFSGYAKPETLTNFPALVIFGTNLPGFSYSQVSSASGGDLRFTDDTGTNTLYHEVDTWSTSGKSYVWVQVPRLTNNCSIWAYWGNPSATTPPGYTTDGSVWDANFVGVWHMNSTTSPDSTANRLNATTASGNTNAAGLVGGGQGFVSASSTHMVVPNDAKMIFGPTLSYTFSAWGFVPATPSGWHALAVKAPGSSGYYGIWENGNTWVYGGVPGLWNAGVPVTNSWNCVAIYQNATSLTRGVYANGALGGSAPGVNSDTTSTGDMWFGGGGTEFFDGLLDEIRLEKVARSASWEWACYMTMGSNAIFTAYGEVRGGSTSSGIAAHGTPVSWLQSHGFSTNFDVAELTDLDGDGAQAWQEYIAGTDPNNAQSVFEMSIQRIANGVVISFPSLSATGSDYAGKVRYYALESSTNLALGWQLVYSNLVGSDGSVIYMNTSPGRREYYRARVRLQ